MGKRQILVNLDESLIDAIDAVTGPRERSAWIGAACEAALAGSERPPIARPRASAPVRQAARRVWVGPWVPVHCLECGQRWDAQQDALDAGAERCPRVSCLSPRVGAMVHDGGNGNGGGP